MPYFTSFLLYYENYRLSIIISGDIMLLISLFVLGGEFWGKLQALFIYKATVIYRDD